MPPRDSTRTALLVLSYVPLLGLVPLLRRDSDAEVRWHARNGLLLFGSVIAIGVAATVLGIAVPALSCLYGIVMFFVAVLYTVIAILAVVKALQGERLIVPGISRYAGRP